MAVVVALVGLFQKRADLKAAKPRTEAETSQVNLAAQGETVNRLREENVRLDERNKRLEARADASDEALDKANTRIDQIIAELERQQQQYEGFRRRVESMWLADGTPTPDWWHGTNPGADAPRTP